MSTPLSFSNSELSLLSTLSTPIPPAHRGSFLQAVADHVAQYPEAARGDGLLHRVGAALQRQFLSEPPPGRAGKYC